MQEKKEERRKASDQLLPLTGNLSNIFGEATMRGFLKFRTICLLSRWKYCAGVVGCTTTMFTVSPSTPSSALSHIWERSERKETFGSSQPILTT